MAMMVATTTKREAFINLPFILRLQHSTHPTKFPRFAAANLRLKDPLFVGPLTYPENVEIQKLPLTDQERAMLDFERRGWPQPMAKEQAIAQTFGLAGPRYYQLLNALIDRQEALAADPLVVKRLRRLRDNYRVDRQSRKLLALR